MYPLKYIGWIGVLSVLVFASEIYAQQPELQRHLTRGKLWATFRNTGTQGLRDDSRLGADAGLMYPGWGIGERDFREYWIIGQDNDHRYHTSQGEGFWVFTREGGSYNVSISNPRYNTDDIFEMIYDAASGPERDLGVETRSPLTGNTTANYWPGAPALVADEPIEIHNYDYGRYIPNDNEAEEIIISKWTTERGLTITRKARAWSYPDYDDFIILEVIIENTGDNNGDGTPDAGLPVDHQDVYFAFVNNLAPSWAGHRWQNQTVPWAYSDPIILDDWYKYSEASNFDGLPALRGKKISYVYDSDLLSSAGDDTGQPFDKNNAKSAYVNRGQLNHGELMAFQYIGLAPLDYDPTDGFTNDNETYVAPKTMDQPAFANWWEIYGRFDWDTPDITNLNSEENLYNEFIGLGRVPAIQDNPSKVSRVTFAHTYGPYDLAPGEKAKVVVAWVAGSGAEFAGPGGSPMDVYEWARQGNQSQVADGERAMAQHLERAQFAYDNNYDLPDAPPDVAIFVDSDENGNNAITWSDRAEKSPDPDYTGDEALDLQGYRVYRTQNNHLGPWELVADIPKGTTPTNTEYDPGTPWTSPTISYSDGGTYTYRDVESVPGFRYWYSVRTYDSGHSDWNGTGQSIPSLESGHSAPEQRMNVSRSPIVIATPEKDALAEQVRVVPNPFRDDPGDADHRYPPASNNIRFVNIPRKAKISIFSISGDLIAVINHPQRTTDPDRGEATWDQRTRTFSGRVAAGRYYYVVESLVAGETGKKQTGMFMIIK